MKIRLAAAAVLSVSVCAFGQAPDRELDMGLKYVEGLQRLYFLDIADKVLAELTAKYPEAATRAAALQLQGDLVRGRFEEVKARIAKRTKEGAPEDVLWAMKLALADSYFTYAKYDECRSIYEGFFKTFKSKDGKTSVPKSLETVYADAAYKYAQMLLSMKKKSEALAMYKVMLGTGKLPEHVARQCMAEMAEIAISLAEETKDVKAKDAYCKDADSVCDKLLWVQDLWFGKAIVLKAHVLMIKNKPGEAQKLVDTYMNTLTMIHQSLVEQEKETGEPLTRVSPMAECRYLLAVMLQEKAEEIMSAEDFRVSDSQKREEVLSLLLGARGPNGKRKGDGAFNHFINVYLRYPESNWAADAGEHSEQVREILVNDFGGKVESKITPEQTARVREIQYRDAQILYKQGQIDQAKERLGQVLNAFPDVMESIGALGDYARCYIQGVQDDPDAMLYAQTIIGHLAERYSAVPAFKNPAGDELIRLAEYWGEYGRPDLRLDTYGLFFRLYPTHPSCVTCLSAFGEKAYQDKDYPHALEFYNIVAQSYTNSPRAFNALSRIASIYEEGEQYEELDKVLDDYVKRLKALPKPTQELFSARYRKASSLRNSALAVIRSGSTNESEIAAANLSLAKANKEFDDLAKDLKTPPPSSQVDEREAKKNAEIREISLFNKALSLTQLPQNDPKRAERMRQMAIAAYEELIADYPKGTVAPTALIQIGSIYAMLKDSEKAESALSRLRKDYPDSEQAKSALPLIADNLMKLGMREEAVARYKEMFAATGTQYSEFDLLRAADALMAAGEYDLARIGLDKVLGALAKDSPILYRASYADARLRILMKDYAGGIAKLKEFIEKYPNFPLVVDAYLLLSQSASEAGLAEKDRKQRLDLFNTSVSAMKEVKKRRTNDLEVAQCDIETGRILARRSKAESEFGDKKQARDDRGKALISYQSFIDSVRPGDTRRLPLVEVAYYEVVPLLIEHGQWEIVAENCTEYIRRFPKGKYVGQFNAWRNQAKIELGTDESKPSSAAPAPSAPPPAAADGDGEDARDGE